jgi:DNA-binding NtrC family response regulator
MNRSGSLASCAALVVLASLPGAATACGDKLSVVGGGVTFDKFAAEHRGNVVLLVEPNSPLRAANEELKLHQALQNAGHRVRTVESRSELAAVLAQAKVDVVLVSLGDADVGNQVESRTGPSMLRVAYKADPTAVAAASDGGECFVLAANKRDPELVHRVGELIAQRSKNAVRQCDSVKPKTTST